MWVASAAVRNDIITSARGQSQPVVRLVLKKTTCASWSAAISEGGRWRMVRPPTLEFGLVLEGVGEGAVRAASRPTSSMQERATARSVCESARLPVPSATWTASRG